MKTTDILQKATFSCAIEETIALTTLSYHFTNPYDYDIETLFSVPLPSHAVFSSLEIELNGTRHTGIIQSKKRAQRTYEKAIENDNTPILFEKNRGADYTLQCGTLRPKDTLIVTLVLAEILRPQGDHVRYFLPTVIAPLFGQEKASRWERHTNSIFVEYPYSMDISIKGALTQSSISIPGVENLTLKNHHHHTELSFSGFLNRDIVVHFNDTPQLDAFYPLKNKLLEGYVSYKQKGSEEITQRLPREIMAVVDCSGSMSGISIKQVRKALLQIIEEMHDNDSLRILLFGSETQWLAKEPLQIGTPQLRRIKKEIENLEADLGGTQLAQALEEAFKEQQKEKLTPHKVRATILISDVQLHLEKSDKEEFIKQAQEAQSALFLVAVGVANLARALEDTTRQTGGTALALDPQEPMAQRIAWLSDRIGQKRLAVEEQTENYSEIPARFAGEYSCQFIIDQFPNEITELSTSHQEALAHIAAYHHFYQKMKSNREFATMHELLTDMTSLILVAERENRENSELPTTVSIPHMQPNSYAKNEFSMVLKSVEPSEIQVHRTALHSTATFHKRVMEPSSSVDKLFAREERFSNRDGHPIGAPYLHYVIKKHRSEWERIMAQDDFQNQAIEALKKWCKEDIFERFVAQSGLSEEEYLTAILTYIAQRYSISYK